MDLILRISLLVLMVLGTACNTPGGDTSVINSKSKVLVLPKAFQFSELKAANGTVVFSWQASKDATNYKVYQGSSITSITTDVTSNCDVNVRSCSISGLGTAPQFFSIDAINSDGIKQVTAIKEVRSVSTFDISTVATGDKQLTITWAPSSGATQYALIYSTATSTSVLNAVTSPYILTGLTNNSTYTIRVVAMNNFNGYLLNTSTNKNGTPLPAPAAPTNLTLSATPTSVNLSWNHTGGTGITYKIFRGVSPTVLSEIATGVTLKSYTDLSTMPGTHYYYSVKAYNGTSSTASIPTQEIRPIGTFSLISSVANSRSEIGLEWTEAVGADTYEINYGYSPGVYLQTKTVTAPDLVANLSELNFDTNHFILVKAKNAIGSSGTTQNSTENEIQIATLANQAPVISSISAQETETDSRLTVNFIIQDSDDELNCQTAMSAFTQGSAYVKFENGREPYCQATIYTHPEHEGLESISLVANDGTSSATAEFNLDISCGVGIINWTSGNWRQSVNAGITGFSTFKFILLKKDGNPCLSNKNPVVLNLKYSSSSEQKDASVGGENLLIPDENGEAKFSFANIERAGEFFIQAKQGNIASPWSSSIIVNRGNSSRLVWEIPPSSTEVGQPFVPAPVIRVTDQFGNFTPESNIQINLQLPNSDNAVLIPTSPQLFSNQEGAASFQNLSINFLGAIPLLDPEETGYPFSVVAEDGNHVLSSAPSPRFFSFSQPINTVTRVTSTIEMLQGPIIHPSLPDNMRAEEVFYDRSRISIGSNHINGQTTSYIWTIVAKNLSDDRATLILYNGSQKVHIAIPAHTETPTIFEERVDVLVGTSDEWRLALQGKDTTIFNSRITVYQQDASKTQIYIPLSSIESTNQKGYVETSSTRMSVPNDFNFHPFSWNPANIQRIDSAHMVVSMSSGKEDVSGCVGLYQKSSGQQVGSLSCTTSIIPEQFVMQEIPIEALQFTDDLEIRASTANSNFPLKIYKTGILLRLISIEKTLAIQTISGAKHGIFAESDQGQNLNESFARNEKENFSTGIQDSIVCYGQAKNGTFLGAFSFIGVGGDMGIKSDSFNLKDTSDLILVYSGEIRTNEHFHLRYETESQESQRLTECQYQTRANFL
jgi:hypothetical protein